MVHAGRSERCFVWLPGARRLCELNVLQQVANMCLTPTVQGAWKRGQTLAVHGLIYNPADGSLKVGTPLKP